MNASINHQFFFPHPPELVWEYLTIPVLLEQWLMKNNFEPVVGREFQFTTNPLPQFDFDGIFHCKVLDIVPLQKLSYSWKGGPGDGSISVDTLVVWTLQKKDRGTELLLNHSGFSKPQNLSILNAMTEGWLKNIHKIAERINDRKHDTSQP